MDYETKKFLEVALHDVKDAVEVAYQRGYEKKEIEIREIRRREYQLGYYNAINEEVDKWKESFDEGYQRGLEEAWECARKIVDMSEKQLSKDYELVSLYHVFNEMSASEAMQKIKDYEERQEKWKEDNSTATDGYAETIFGKMRNATPEERRAVQEGIENISVNTGVNFYDDLQEQQTGEWISDEHEAYTENHDTWECSVCHEPFTLTEGTPRDNRYNFCPNCGAKMKGEAG